MLPTAYEFHWDIGHILFLGIFYSVVAVITVAMGVALRRWLADLGARRAAAIDWEEACHELPDARRACRHALTGAAPSRSCENAFRCDDCPQHSAFAARTTPATGGASPGLDLPAGRLHHRGHTWVEPQPDGSVKVGVDDLAARCFGRPERVLLPAPGALLEAGDRGARVVRGKLEARLFNPMAGEVLEQGDYVGGYLYRLRPTGCEPRFVNLLDRYEAGVWLTGEMELLQRWLAPAGEAATLADGGRPVDDLVRACPGADWDGIWGRLCLES